MNGTDSKLLSITCDKIQIIFMKIKYFEFIEEPTRKGFIVLSLKKITMLKPYMSLTFCIDHVFIYFKL